MFANIGHITQIRNQASVQANVLMEKLDRKMFLSYCVVYVLSAPTMLSCSRKHSLLDDGWDCECVNHTEGTSENSMTSQIWLNRGVHLRR